MLNNIWTEKDDTAINSIIVNILSQQQVFSNLSSNSYLSKAFEIQNTKEYKLGLFTGVVINMFANYWINEHETGLSPTDVEYLHKKIANSKDIILRGLFPPEKY